MARIKTTQTKVCPKCGSKIIDIRVETLDELIEEI
jgi:DNA-directed RNA polymerase subunit RPC12/RpoP